MNYRVIFCLSLALASLVHDRGSEGAEVVLAQGGKSLWPVIISASYDEIARNDVGETCLASMAVSQGQFYIRSSKHLYCIGRSAERSM